LTIVKDAFETRAYARHAAEPRRCPLSARFEERMAEKDVRKDTRLLGDFTQFYCDGNHAEAPRARLESEGVALGVYGRKVPVVCEECAELLAYSERRRAFCPLDPKPFCNYCETHCYKSDMREHMREVMRYAGPKSWRHGHAIDGMKHLIEGRKHRAAAEQAAADQPKN
jgi:hypothetical protein